MEKITDILWARVFSEDGEYLGRVFDLRCQGAPEHGASKKERVVSEVLYGKRSFLEVLGFKKSAVQSVAWESVKAFDYKRVVVGANRFN
jgi:sporulation protein YlmC with PRC-barrel domain